MGKLYRGSLLSHFCLAMAKLTVITSSIGQEKMLLYGI